MAVVAYTVVLVSFDRQAVSVLAPLAVAPLAMLWFTRVPVWFALRRVLLMSPLIAMLCLMSPLYDRMPQPVAFSPMEQTDQIVKIAGHTAMIAVPQAVSVMIMGMSGIPFLLQYST